MTDTEMKPAVRLRVWHRHGPNACGGVLCITRRILFSDEPVDPNDLEFPIGPAQCTGSVLRCDACRAEIFDAAFWEDVREAEAYSAPGEDAA